jgi:hypothetical protein
MGMVSRLTYPEIFITQVSVAILIDSFALPAPIDVYFCRLSITSGGAVIKPISTPTHLSASPSEIWVTATIAKIPGDVRVGGKPISVTGVVSTTPCN